MMKSTTKLPHEITCPHCGYKMNMGGKASHEDEMPEIKEGLLSICFNCASIVRFNADLTIHVVDDAELQTLNCVDREDALLTQQLVLKFRQANPKDLVAKQRASWN